MHRWTTTALVTIAVAAIAAAARSRTNRPLFVVFLRPFSIDSMQANSHGNRETPMANTFQLQSSSRWTLDRVSASMRAMSRAVAAEHTLALYSASKAASPRQSLAEVRAMYLPTDQPQ